MSKAILDQLVVEQKSLIVQMDGLRGDLSKVNAAIAALGGSAQPEAATREGPSVPEIILEAAKSLTSKLNDGGKSEVVMDNKALKQEARSLHPQSGEKIRMGIYTAVAKLVKDKKLLRVPNGFQLA